MKAKSAIVLPVLVIAIIAQSWLHTERIFPFWGKHYAPRMDSDYSALSPEHLLLSLAGFREMIARILWVRADNYFDEGKYDAILPMIQVVTMLDPKQIDVYSVGIWHIAYNFTDEANRSDRRYIQPAIALGRDGVKHNDHNYELYFEMGWLWYHKIDDEYSQSVNWFEQANEFDYEDLKARYMSEGDDFDRAVERAQMNSIPYARQNLLSQAYLRNGQMHKAEELYDGLLEGAVDRTGDLQYGVDRRNRDTIENNLDNLLMRMSQRGTFAMERNETDLSGYDITPPFNIGFSASVTVLEPKVLLVQGTWRVQPIGTHIRFILRDKEYEGAIGGGMLWDTGDKVNLATPSGQTFLQDLLFVKNQRFSRRIDMSRDVTMYPLTGDEYVMEFYYNPRSAAEHIQDKFGFNGEGMTDDFFLNTDIREGQRVIFASISISKEMLKREGEFRVGRTTPVVSTPNYDSSGATVGTGVVQVPGLRAN